MNLEEISGILESCDALDFSSIFLENSSNFITTRKGSSEYWIEKKGC